MDRARRAAVLDEGASRHAFVCERVRRQRLGSASLSERSEQWTNAGAPLSWTRERADTLFVTAGE